MVAEEEDATDATLEYYVTLYMCQVPGCRPFFLARGNCGFHVYVV